MLLEEFIIKTYVYVDDFLKKTPRLRKRGPAPKLSDAEVITLEIVGEFLGLGTDKQIFEYFKNHWGHWFPFLNTRVTFIRQGANLFQTKEALRKKIVLQRASRSSVFLCDGLPIPTCHKKRVRQKNHFQGYASFGYCAAKEESYFGFKGHLLTTKEGLIMGFTFTAANVDERLVVPELTEGLSGQLIADKGYLSPDLSGDLASKNLFLHTPLRKNMKDSRPKEVVSNLMNTRRKIETVIGQLVSRFKVQSIRAQNMFHLSAKLSRKILSHTFAFFLNDGTNFDQILS